MTATRSLKDGLSQQQIDALRAGDSDAFEALFRAHYAALCSFAESYVRAPDIAEELVQSVFLRLWANRERTDIPHSVRAYLYQAVHNQALNHVARLRRERGWVASMREGSELNVRDALVSTPPKDPAALLESHEVALRVQHAIASLPERAQLAVRLRWTHQLSYAEIAEVMEISVKGVEVTLARAREALRRGLGGRG